MTHNYWERNQTNFKIKIWCFAQLASKIFSEQPKYCIIIFYNNREFERKRIFVSSSISMNPTFKSSDGSQNEIKYETSLVNCNNAIYLDETSFTLEILLINMGSCKWKVFSQKKTRSNFNCNYHYVHSHHRKFWFLNCLKEISTMIKL